jgi:DNA repair exonuclease SbcCD ATPase subunit
MESLMIDLATKITFSHFAYCPMSSFFILDENISVLDEHHIQNIEILFDFLKQHYHHVLLISHLPHMKNVVDKNVTIIKTNGYSQIQCCL